MYVCINTCMHIQNQSALVSNPQPPPFHLLLLFQIITATYSKMGSTESQHVVDQEQEKEESQDEDEQEEEEDNNEARSNMREPQNNGLVKKVVEQEPEMSPRLASTSPLSPQLSSFGTPRMGPSPKAWDPFNAFGQPPPVFSRNFPSDDDRMLIEVYLINHGESELDLRPDIVGGRYDAAAMTSNGKRQARALAVFLHSQGVRFDAIYCSPLDRARSMALYVCQVNASVFFLK